MRDALLPQSLLLSLGLAAAACGGGGGGGAAVPQPTPPAGGLTLAGGIQPANAHFVDSDTGDPFANRQSNNSVAAAQRITLPALVAGYAECRSDACGEDPDQDDLDLYRVGLIPGTPLTLEVASETADDLDLAVFSTEDADGDGQLDLVAQSINAGSRSERIEFNGAEGEYLVGVFAFEGASAYILTLGPPSLLKAHAAQAPPTAQADFVPGQLLLEWAAAGRKSARAATQALQPVAQPAQGPGLYALPPAGIRKAARPPRWPAGFAAPRPDAALATQYALKQARQDPAVAWAGLNHIRRAWRIPNDRLFDLQWPLQQLRAPQAWDLTQGAPGVRVAVVDTGVRSDHPELDSLLSNEGYDFISDPVAAGDGDGPDPDPFDAGDGERAGENSYHGTHVAGTVAVESNNEVGIAALNWRGQLLALRTLGRGGSGTDFDIARAIRYAAGQDIVPGRRIAPVDVINLSLGGPGRCADTAFASAIAAARAAGVIVVAAAGNESTAEDQVPASCAGTVSVAATNIREGIAFYSNFGRFVDVAAPGGDIGQDANGDGVPDGVLSTLWNDEFNEPVLGLLEGTSMAAPHVAGVAALMKARDPTLSPQRFDSLLAAGALTRDAGAPGRDDRFGHGIVDAALAVRAVTEEVAPFLASDPTQLFLGTANAGEFTLRNAGNGAIRVLAIDDDANFEGVDWLRIEALEVDGNGLGRYRVRIDRSGLPEQSAALQAQITVQADTGQTLRIDVFINLVSDTAPGELGRIYVLLLDADGEVLDETVAQRVGARYQFAFDGLPAGAYALIAGSDHDGDFEICDAGEACGAFPTLDRIEVFELSGNRTLPDFAARLEVTLEAGMRDNAASSNAPSATRKGYPLRREPPQP